MVRTVLGVLVLLGAAVALGRALPDLAYVTPAATPGQTVDLYFQQVQFPAVIKASLVFLLGAFLLGWPARRYPRRSDDPQPAAPASRTPGNEPSEDHFHPRIRSSACWFWRLWRACIIDSPIGTRCSHRPRGRRRMPRRRCDLSPAPTIQPNPGSSDFAGFTASHPGRWIVGRCARPCLSQAEAEQSGADRCGAGGLSHRT